MPPLVARIVDCCYVAFLRHDRPGRFLAQGFCQPWRNPRTKRQIAFQIRDERMDLVLIVDQHEPPNFGRPGRHRSIGNEPHSSREASLEPGATPRPFSPRIEKIRRAHTPLDGPVARSAATVDAPSGRPLRTVSSRPIAVTCGHRPRCPPVPQSRSPDLVLQSGRLDAYSITSSARVKSNCGTVSPSSLTVLRLMTSCNLVGCCTGKSAGRAPLRIFAA